MTLIARMQKGILARVVTDPAAGMSRATLRALRLSCLGMVLVFAPVAGQAQGENTGGVVDHPVLLELYTAQGCASCPPADDMLIDLASREDVIALALHVDYWDYIGWADTFASRANTERQQRYARRYGHSTIYTPQVIVNGTQIVEGFRVMEVMDTISMQRERAGEVSLSLSRSAEGLTIRAVPTEEAAPQIAMASRRSATAGMGTNSVVGTLTMSRPQAAEADVADAPEVAAAEPEAPVAEGGAGEPEAAPQIAAAPEARLAIPAPQAEPARNTLGRPGSGPYAVQLVRYRPMDEVDILGGENAGRTSQYANIVTSWQVLGSWDMMSPLEVTVPLEGDEPAVVIVQETGQGEVVASARLR
ncbi:DUF1223 domain-containing protein [Cereibacter sphaeroides]|nr:DUF1223 domain-containing protein [Cereibacter sphaeroides]